MKVTVVCLVVKSCIVRDTVKCSFGQILSVVKWKDLEFHEGGKHMDLIYHTNCPMAPAQAIPKGIYGSVVTFFFGSTFGTFHTISYFLMLHKGKIDLACNRRKDIFINKV